MFFGKGRTRDRTARYRDTPVFQPQGEQLEAKILMAIDLGGTSPPNQPFSASVPYGIDMVGGSSSLGAGYSVADVADLTGNNNYDSLVIGAPGISSPTSLSGADGKVYVVLGSSYAASSTNLTATQNWLNVTGQSQLVASDRVGSFSELGTPNPGQTNPISGTALNFGFTGVTITGPASFGASVAGVTLPGGTNAIIVGAPDANSGAGAVYVISGNFGAAVGQTFTITATGTGNVIPTGITVVTITNTATYATSGNLGYSVAGGSNILGDGASDIILGAPNASVAMSTTSNPVVQNTGVVYVLSANALSGNTTINLGTLTTNSVFFAGAASGDMAGSSVADGGDVNGASGSVDDLLVGSPSANAGAGAAYLVYGGSNLAGLRTTVNGVPFISLSNLAGGSGTGTTVPGATFMGPNSQGTEAGLGLAVSAGGDFNADGFADILLGAPNYSSSTSFADQGEAFLFYGAASTSGGYLTGLIDLNNISANLSPATFVGGIGGNLAGYALSQVGVINAGQPTGILIGAPGYNANSGTAYLIPGRANFSGSYSLSSISSSPSAPLVGLQLVESTPTVVAGGTQAFFGASLSGRLQGTQKNTVDTDAEADFIIGAPGYSSLTSLAGNVQIVESGFLQVPIPQSLTVTVPIGVSVPFPPFPTINATTPSTLQIYVFGSTATTPAFMPVTDIDPTTVKVDGVAFPNATITQDTDSGNYQPDNIPDAIITISPRSALNLVNGTQAFTITGQTLGSSPLPNYTWTGTATITVSGGTPGPPTIAAAVAPAIGPVTQTQYVSPFGANQYSPSITAFSALTYQPIPLSVALNEYLPPTGFRARLYSYNHKGKKVGINRAAVKNGPGGNNELEAGVYTRGAYHPQKVYKWTHKTAKVGIVKGVVPTQSKNQTFVDDLLH